MLHAKASNTLVAIILTNHFNIPQNVYEQILTQEDWNVVLFNGMEKTSHWAALYFVALMTFGNYVLFNLLVAILVEGFSSEVNFIIRIHITKSDKSIILCLWLKYFL